MATKQLYCAFLALALSSVIKEASPEWVYSQEKEGMGSGTTYQATVSSSNTVNFKQPYSGEQHASIYLESFKNGNGAILRIVRGQFLCRSYEDCIVLAQFDNEKETYFTGRGSPDGSTETIYLNNYKKFLNKISHAKHLKLATTNYQAGNPIFEFDVSGFDMKKYKP
jgi:hypothetical protein